MKYVKNITGGKKFPLKQELPWKETEKGEIVLLKAGEQLETTWTSTNEPRLEIVDEKEKKVK